MPMTIAQLRAILTITSFKKEDSSLGIEDKTRSLQRQGRVYREKADGTLVPSVMFFQPPPKDKQTSSDSGQHRPGTP